MGTDLAEEHLEVGKVIKKGLAVDGGEGRHGRGEVGVGGVAGMG